MLTLCFVSFKIKHLNPIAPVTLFIHNGEHWSESSDLCSLNNSQLVSIEDEIEKELNFFNSMGNDERKDHVYAVVHIQLEQRKVTFCKDLVV